jgi:hypothetical protein
MEDGGQLHAAKTLPPGKGVPVSIGDMGNAYNILARKPEGKRPLGRHSHKWEDNITMDLR